MCEPSDWSIGFSKATLNASGFQVLGLDVYVKGQGEERDQHRGESNHRRQKTKALKP